ncbi:MAG: aminopeptidase [Treponema sp.]|jgi:predicted aminopeptidase|nr:aminopeptidase [Treponema sp.]
MKLFSFLPALLASLVLLGGMILFSGCYTLKQGFTMLGYLNSARPLETLMDESSSVEERRFAGRIGDIRRFAVEELGLKETKNYTRYVAIDRSYLAAVVSASARDSFIRHEWWFPVVGAVPYKGFFKLEDARREGKKLEKRDLDVWIRGVDAFSTLGWFRDPLYSYMRDYPIHRLADLIIHELLHATVYLPGRSQFNEELAEFVGTEGARLYVERTFGAGSEEYRRMVDEKADNAAFVAFIKGLIGELEDLYQSGVSREEKLRRKEVIIREAQRRFEAEYETRFRGDAYRGFSKLSINNAYLELYRLYYGGDDFYRDLYERSGRSLPAFIAAAKTIGGKDDPRSQMERALLPKP